MSIICILCGIHLRYYYKKRIQIKISEEIKKQMDDAKDFYGGYSGLIEKAVDEFLSRPVEPYEDYIKDIE